MADCEAKLVKSNSSGEVNRQEEVKHGATCRRIGVVVRNKRGGIGLRRVSVSCLISSMFTDNRC